jgi:hypothetical protein
MTNSARYRAMLQQERMAAQYQERFEALEAKGDKRAALDAYVLWHMHSENARVWAARLA